MFSIHLQKEIIMEAARLQKVEDRLDLGTDALRSLAGTQESGKTPTSGLQRGTAGPGPAPTPAKNSGTKLDASFLAPSFTASNGEGRQYNAKDDSKASGSLPDPDGGNFTPSASDQNFQSSTTK